MKHQEFNPQEYAKLKHRVEQLKSRVTLDIGSEQKIAQRLLAKVEEKLKEYEQTHEIPKEVGEDYNTTSSLKFWKEQNTKKQTIIVEENYGGEWNPNLNFKWHVSFDKYYEDLRSEEEMINDLGIGYMIFGSTYQTVLNYHTYKIRFKKQIDKQGAFYRVCVDIYEDDVRICKDVVIGFWPLRRGDDRCGDMQFACMDNGNIEKYNCGCSILYEKLINELKDIWNTYFDEQNFVPMLTGEVDDSFETTAQYNSDNALEEYLNEDQRKEIIEKTEAEIDSGKMVYLKERASKIEVASRKSDYILKDFLEQSGVVYKVDSGGVYLWNYLREEYGKLVGYNYDKVRNRYYIYLL